MIDSQWCGLYCRYLTLHDAGLYPAWRRTLPCVTPDYDHQLFNHSFKLSLITKIWKLFEKVWSNIIWRSHHLQSDSMWLIKNFLNNHDWFMIRNQHFNTYMEWKFKSLRIWPSEKSIDREFRLRHFWKFFWDNNQKSFWDSCQMFTLNHPVHHNDKSITKIMRNNRFTGWCHHPHLK